MSLLLNLTFLFEFELKSHSYGQSQFILLYERIHDFGILRFFPSNYTLNLISLELVVILFLLYSINIKHFMNFLKLNDIKIHLYA